MGLSGHNPIISRGRSLLGTVISHFLTGVEGCPHHQGHWELLEQGRYVDEANWTGSNGKRRSNPLDQASGIRAQTVCRFSSHFLTTGGCPPKLTAMEPFIEINPWHVCRQSTLSRLPPGPGLLALHLLQGTWTLSPHPHPAVCSLPPRPSDVEGHLLAPQTPTSPSWHPSTKIHHLLFVPFFRKMRSFEALLCTGKETPTEFKTAASHQKGKAILDLPPGCRRRNLGMLGSSEHLQETFYVKAFKR